MGRAFVRRGGRLRTEVNEREPVAAAIAEWECHRRGAPRDYRRHRCNGKLAALITPLLNPCLLCKALKVWLYHLKDYSFFIS